jgi:HD-like signal output (HDOD) protein
VIASDPAMTARLLKLVNSAYFGLAKPVADVTRAGALLGLDRIMALVLGQGIFSECDPPKVEGFSMDELWNHSVTTAAAAHRIAIAEHLDRDQVAAAFLAGMLHDIGKLVLAMGLPEQYAKVLKQAGDRPGDLQQIEMLELRAAHTDVGAYLVGLWGLPNTIAEAIAYHEDPSQSPNPKFGLAGIVHVADRLAHYPDVTDVRSPELGLNLAYLESQQRIGHWHEWREACAPTMTGKSS